MRRKRTPTPFGHAIRVRLAQLEMNQGELAKKLGVSRAYVTYLIYGDRPDEAWVARICEVLGMATWKDDAIQ